jgi:hypothetical protein
MLCSTLEYQRGCNVAVQYNAELKSAGDSTISEDIKRGRTVWNKSLSNLSNAVVSRICLYRRRKPPLSLVMAGYCMS